MPARACPGPCTCGCRCPISSYKGDPAKTEANRLRGYFTVGDIGYLDDDGFLFLCDRKADVIISGGANIYPAEVEAAIIVHPRGSLTWPSSASPTTSGVSG